MDHDTNVVGAAVVLLGDRLRDAVETAGGHVGARPAALAALHEWADGKPIDRLAATLRLSHSRAVRVVDGLVRDGLAVRRPDPGDARLALVELTPDGHRAGQQVMAARNRVLTEALSPLSDDERAQFARLAETLLRRGATGRRAAGAICRLCDVHACGHHDGRCPSTAGANAYEAARAQGGSRSRPC